MTPEETPRWVLDAIVEVLGAPLPRRPCPVCWNAPEDYATGGACGECMKAAWSVPEELKG